MGTPKLGFHMNSCQVEIIWWSAILRFSASSSIYRLPPSNLRQPQECLNTPKRQNSEPHDATWREALKLVVLVCFPSDSQWIVLDIGWLCVWDQFKSAYNWQFRINMDQPSTSLQSSRSEMFHWWFQMFPGSSSLFLRLSWWTHCRPEPKEWHDHKLP